MSKMVNKVFQPIVPSTTNVSKNEGHISTCQGLFVEWPNLVFAAALHLGWRPSSLPLGRGERIRPDGHVSYRKEERAMPMFEAYLA